MGKYILSETPSGQKTLIYSNTTEVRIHSKYDPLKESANSVKDFQCGRANYIFICGMGLGYHIQSLKDSFPHHGIIVAEKDSEVVALALEHCPTNLERVSIVTPCSDISTALEEFDMSHFQGMAVYYHRPSYSLDRDWYDNMVADANRYVSSRLSDLLTRFEFEEKWIENIFKNIHKVLFHPPVKQLFGKFSNVPGIIVSAGPSLRKNIDHLHLLRNKALIVSVDTAFKVLARRGIYPHIVMTLDAQKHSIKHFLGTEKNESWLLADLVSYPRISDYYGSNVVFSTTAKYYTGRDGLSKREATPTVDWIEKHMEAIGDIQSGGSVATSAFDLLLNLGCSPIVLVGQDLAYTGREIHCSGTYHNDEWLPGISRFLNLDTINQKVVRKRKIKYVPAFGGRGRVISDYVFDLYRGWFEDSAGKVSQPVINATEGGAGIANTSEKQLAGLVDAFPNLTDDPVRILKKLLYSPDVGYNSLKNAMERAVKKLSELKDLDTGTTAAQGAEDILPDGLLEDPLLSGLISPLLRKTNAYLARNPDMDPDKTASFIAKGIKGASNKLYSMMNRSLKNIELRSRYTGD